jgi:hypothetical protein
MATKRLIDATPLIDECRECKNIEWNKSVYTTWAEAEEDFMERLLDAPTVDAVEVEEYNALLEMYHELRENFIDYYCSGSVNVAPYCLNKCEECVDKCGYCKQYSDYCKGFNPAEVILDGAKRDGYGNGN